MQERAAKNALMIQEAKHAMTEQKPYRTVAGLAEAEHTEKKSRFIGCIRPVATEEEALAFVEERRRLHRDARHNVFAFALKDGLTRRCSDDGEPQGTGGVPVLDVLQKEGLTDVCVVVTRYFGGILLGAGGLVRAYSLGARLAVQAAEVLDMRPCAVVEVRCDYEQYGRVSHLLPQFAATVLESDFGAAVRLLLLMAEETAPPFFEAVREATAARAVCAVQRREFSAAPRG